jgi:hypothetical protein
LISCGIKHNCTNAEARTGHSSPGPFSEHAVVLSTTNHETLASGGGVPPCHLKLFPNLSLISFGMSRGHHAPFRAVSWRSGSPAPSPEFANSGFSWHLLRVSHPLSSCIVLNLLRCACPLLFEEHEQGSSGAKSMRGLSGLALHTTSPASVVVCWCTTYPRRQPEVHYCVSTRAAFTWISRR